MINKLIKISVLAGLILLIIIACIFCLINNLEVNYVKFIQGGIYFCFSIFCVMIAIDYKIKWLPTGWIFFSVALLEDIIDELDFFELPEGIDYLFELSLGFGIILIAYGFYKSLQEKEILLGKLEYLAYYDELADLPNRRYIKDYLTIAIKNAYQNQNKVGVFFIDLDGFKLINDTLGHHWGDMFLKLVADKLKDVTRDGDQIARLGGDEFIIIIQDIDDLDVLNEIAQKIVHEFQKPLSLKGKEVHSTCSIGVSVLSEEGMTTELLFKNADIAMYKAKEAGGNNYRFYDKTMDERAMENLQIVEELRRALYHKELILHYQPKINIKTGKITSLEALVRWNHPKLGLIYPNYFIDIAEEAGLITDIDLHVLELACLQIKDWTRRNLKPMNISVNISAKLFNEHKFIHQLEHIVSLMDIDPSFISIEITETASMKDIQYTTKVLNHLKKKHINICIDDFGKGYSSLNYLKIFPIDILKIDKLFVDGISKDKRDETLIKATVDMAKALDIKVVSEGVETKEQLAFLESIGCDEYQGYLFSKPMPIVDLEKITSNFV